MDKELSNIIARVKQNQEGAFKELVNKFAPMIYSTINQFTLEKGDYLISQEDLYQEGCLALYEACMDFKEDYGASFSTFAYIVIKRKLNKVFYKMIKQYENEGMSYDKFPKDKARIMRNIVEEKSIIYDVNKIDEMHNHLDFEFSEEDKQIIQMRIDGASYKEIASVLGIKPKRVDNRITRIKKALKTKMENKNDSEKP